MTPNELYDVLDLACEQYHNVAKSHGVQRCNCFRDDFGKALIAKYGFNGDEMITEQERRLHHVRAFNVTVTRT